MRDAPYAKMRAAVRRTRSFRHRRRTCRPDRRDSNRAANSSIPEARFKWMRGAITALSASGRHRSPEGFDQQALHMRLGLLAAALPAAQLFFAENAALDLDRCPLFILKRSKFTFLEVFYFCRSCVLASRFYQSHQAYCRNFRVCGQLQFPDVLISKPCPAESHFSKGAPK